MCARWLVLRLLHAKSSELSSLMQRNLRVFFGCLFQLHIQFTKRLVVPNKVYVRQWQRTVSSERQLADVFPHRLAERTQYRVKRGHSKVVRLLFAINNT